MHIDLSFSPTVWMGSGFFPDQRVKMPPERKNCDVYLETIAMPYCRTKCTVP